MNKKKYTKFLNDLGFDKNQADEILNFKMSNIAYHYFATGLRFAPQALYAFGEYKREETKHMYYLVFFTRFAYEKCKRIKDDDKYKEAVDHYEEIYLQAMKYLKRNKTLGIEDPIHLTQIVLKRIIKIKSLNFQIVKLNKKIELKDRVLNEKTPCVHINVCDEQNFSYQDAIEALRKARKKFSKIDNFVINTWLLAPSLKNVLEPEHDIIKFQDHFETYAKSIYTLAAEACLFGMPQVKIENYVVETPLQKAVYDLLSKKIAVPEMRAVLINNSL